MFFSGRPTNARKIDLRGRSRGEETREQVLERTRGERERRQRSKLEHKSALLIQSHWRQLATARRVQAELREQWTHLCGLGGSEQAIHDLLVQNGRLLPSLLYYYDPKQEADRQALALVCSALTASAAAGTCSPLVHAATAAHVTKSSGAPPPGTAALPAGPNQAQLALFRLQKLALLCLSTLAAGGAQAAAALSSPFASLASLRQQPLAAMLDFLIKIVNPDTWQPSLKGHMQQQQQQADTSLESATAGAEAMLTYLFNKHLTAYLRMLLLVVNPSAPSKTCAEVCVTQMVVRALKLQLVPVMQPQLPAQPAAAASTSTPALTSPATATVEAAVQLGVSQLLFVPGLWTKAGSLVPVSGRLCSVALVELGQLTSSKQLVDVLLSSTTAAKRGSTSRPSSSSLLSPSSAAASAIAVDGAVVDGAAITVGALVENIIEAAAAGLLPKGTNQAEQVTLAGKLVSSLVVLLDAARQLSVLQRRQWRAKAHKHSQSRSPGRSIYDTGTSTGDSRKAGYVPGAGFVGPRGAAAMEVDEPGLGSGAAAAAAAEPGAETGAAAMEVDVEQSSVLAAGAAAGAAGAADDAEMPGAAAAASAAGTEAVPSSAAATGDKAIANKAAAADAAVLDQPVAASAWSAEQAASNQPSEVTASEACMQLLAGSTKGLQLLRLLVTTLLPATTAAEARSLQRQQQAVAANQPAASLSAAVFPGCAAQHQLLQLVWSLSRAPEYRQKVLLGLSVGARLVPRLWFSLVLPLHLSTAGGLLYYTDGSSSSSRSRQSSSGGTGVGVREQDAAAGSSSSPASAVPGSWVLPMLVLCQAFTAALSFTHMEDFYAAEGAASLVPLSQLYDAAAPAAGLVLLVKAAVWQILWFNSVSPPGLPPPPPAVQQQLQQLKVAVAEVCGLLLCQLHDRNCIRPFCPAEAFLCELATAAPARLEQEFSAAAARIGTSWDDNDEDASGADDAAWQQQQQWQQQRQQGLVPVGAVIAGAVQDEGMGGRVSSSGGTAAAAAGADALDDDHAAAAAGGGGRSPGSRVWLLLDHAPCLVPFELRVELLQHVLSLEKEQATEANMGMHEWDDPFMGPNRFVTIRRDQLVEDGFNEIGRMDPDRIKGRLRIQYVNEAGLAEAGIDGGGLFKDFMEELLRQGFSPQSNLMAENPQHQLYPNPAAFPMWPDAEYRLGFLGRMLGKCLYEGMLLELPLAAFFLKKMRGGVCDINDMPALDPEVYKHLLQLRHYTGDFDDLSLTFTATVTEPVPESRGGGTRQREVELKPGGRDIAVRADNVIEYIHRLADFRLNRQMDRAAAAFLRGFFELIKPRWVRMFNEAELQMLISGSEEGVDVDDLMKHINFAGGYHEQHPVILTLWETLRGFNPQQQRQFLKFVTSCSRAPLLGFAYLEPRVCVQMSGGVLQPGATQRLPTAATCMNLLKLPPYRSIKEMREKLLYAISAGAGFELS